jgi:hypothetical protein
LGRYVVPADFKPYTQMVIADTITDALDSMNLEWSVLL